MFNTNAHASALQRRLACPTPASIRCPRRAEKAVILGIGCSQAWRLHAAMYGQLAGITQAGSWLVVVSRVQRACTHCSKAGGAGSSLGVVCVLNAMQAMPRLGAGRWLAF